MPWLWRNLNVVSLSSPSFSAASSNRSCISRKRFTTCSLKSFASFITVPFVVCVGWGLEFWLVVIVRSGFGKGRWDRLLDVLGKSLGALIREPQMRHVAVRIHLGVEDTDARLRGDEVVALPPPEVVELAFVRVDHGLVVVVA